MSVDLDALATELARLDILIEAEMRQMRARYDLSLDEFRGLYITDERVEALLAAQPSEQSRVIPDIAMARRADQESRWHQFAVALELTDDERDVVLVCLAPELDPKYETLYAYLNDDVLRRWATVDLVIRILGRDDAHRFTLRGLLSPVARLLASGTIEASGGDAETSAIRRPLRAARPLGDWVLGHEYADERLADVVRPANRTITVPDEALPLDLRGMLSAIVARVADGGPLPPTVLAATTMGESAFLAEQLVARADRSALVLDVSALRRAPSPPTVVGALGLMRTILGLELIVSGLDEPADPDGRSTDNLFVAMDAVGRQAPAVIYATSTQYRDGGVFDALHATTVAIPEPSTIERAVAWRHRLAIESNVPATALSDELVIALADRFAFGLDRIVQAAALAQAAAVLVGASRPSDSHAFAAARSVSLDGASRTTVAITSVFDWEDLILPTDAKTRLADIVRAIEQRSRVLDEWGFGRRVGASRGMKVMFSGPSGTGKTMAAGVVAKQLGLDLHRIELGAVVSKYIGETEKNLDRAFGAARRANAILFMDEADALLGKRSEVKDAHDRYANVEVAYLLQKMEDFDGIVIVATNLAQNIDDAFSRRMHYVLEFPLPDASSRERLWRGMIPSAAPVAVDVDYTFLGRQFELAGGDIRNSVLDAAYAAARESSEITFGHLLRAVARQFAKRGQVPTQSEFREHFTNLATRDWHPVDGRVRLELPDG